MNINKFLNVNMKKIIDIELPKFEVGNIKIRHIIILGPAVFEKNCKYNSEVQKLVQLFLAVQNLEYISKVSSSMNIPRRTGKVKYKISIFQHYGLKDKWNSASTKISHHIYISVH